jgi:hypothetical protein
LTGSECYNLLLLLHQRLLPQHLVQFQQQVHLVQWLTLSQLIPITSSLWRSGQSRWLRPPLRHGSPSQLNVLWPSDVESLTVLTKLMIFTVLTKLPHAEAKSKQCFARECDEKASAMVKFFSSTIVQWQ